MTITIPHIKTSVKDFREEIYKHCGEIKAAVMEIKIGGIAITQDQWETKFIYPTTKDIEFNMNGKMAAPVQDVMEFTFTNSEFKSNQVLPI